MIGGALPALFSLGCQVRRGGPPPEEGLRCAPPGAAGRVRRTSTGTVLLVTHPPFLVFPPSASDTPEGT